MRFWISISLLTLIALLLVCHRGNKQENRVENNTLVAIGDWNITEEVFRSELKKRGLLNAPLTEKKAVMDSILKYQILLSSAVSAGYDQNPSVLEAMNRMMVNKYKEDHLGVQYQALVITKQDISQYYESKKEDFLLPEKIRGAVIVIHAPPSKSQDERIIIKEQLEAIRIQAMKHDSSVFGFGKLALEHSDDSATRPRGGDMGWVRSEQPHSKWAPPLLKHLFELTEGAISPVIEMDDAFYLLKATSRKPKAYRPLKSVSATIKSTLIRNRKQALKEAFMGQARSECAIEKNDQLLERLWKQFEQEKTAKRGPPSMGSR